MIIGRLGADVELRHTQSGDATATLSVATSSSWKDKNGERQERTEWHRVVVWKKLAEICGTYLSKGDLVYFEGELQTRKWTNKDGADQYTTEIRASQMQMLSTKRKEDKDEPVRSRAGGGSAKHTAPADDFDDDIPF
jgi:single-strand DNA-binding protein